MRLKSKTATVLIYTIVLVNLSLLMAIVILNNGSLLSSSKQTENFATKLINNITDSVNVNIKLHKTLNNNGSWFIDDIACPNNVTMSGVTSIVTDLVFTWWVVYCTGDYLSSNDFKIYFNADLDNLDVAEYNNEFRSITGLTTSAFSDGAILNLNTTTSYLRSDDIDDNFNSDNYRVNSTWAVDYPDGYGDDDTNVRKTIYGYVSPDAGFTKIFWSNEKTNRYISDNTNNDDIINARASTSSWFLVLDADKSFDIKILELDRAAYSNLNEIRAINTIDNSVATWLIGHIQTDGSLDSANASGYEFDFPNKDYAVFLNNTGTWVLFYTLSGEALSGSGLYINPIIDDHPSMIRVLGNDIILNPQWLYIWKQSEIVVAK